MKKTTFCLPGINPEPWAIGPLGYRNIGGKIRPFVGPNLKLQSFQNEVKDELKRTLEPDHKPFAGECTLSFFFWRRLDIWETPTGRQSGAHGADTTNLQKGTEDALQGVIISNDRNVKIVSSEIVEQGQDVSPGLIIILYEYEQPVMFAGLDEATLSEFNITREFINKVEIRNEW